MVYTCCVPGCKTGYKSNQTSQKISLFRFPKDAALKAEWVQLIPRENWTLTDSHRVCANHFYDEDFEKESTDKRTNRRVNRETSELNKLRLKVDAIPRIFDGLPKYLSKELPVSRSTSKSTAAARCGNENKRLERQIQHVFLQDQFEDFEVFKLKIAQTTLPSGYAAIIDDACMHFVYLQCSKETLIAPKLAATITITNDLDVCPFVFSTPVPKSAYKHLLKSESVSSTTEVCNILALCKVLSEPSDTNKNDRTSIINLAISSLQRFVALNLETKDLNTSYLPLLKFIIEQIQLMEFAKSGRRYSMDILLTSFFWKLTSNSLYKKLREFFILPSSSTLHKLLSDTSVESGTVDLNYLKKRTMGLTEQQRIVTLMIDEVYTAQRVEYCNGSFIGLTEDGLPAKTILAFMIQSTCDKYKDVVCLVPINKLDTNTLRTWFDKVMRALDEFVFVVAVSVDNHICNRKLYMDLCGGKLTNSVAHPTRDGEQLFLVFDFTHNIKNIFNAFVNKDRMHIPTNSFEHILGEKCIASFSHVKRLYALEEGKTLKIAHSLKKVSLDPSSIARTSPQHALSIFSESTANGLEYYASSYSQFSETSRYIKFIGNIWKILSLKTPSKGARKRDEMCEPMTVDDGHIGLKYIAQAREIFVQWKKSGNSGLTRETFAACIQSMGSIPELAVYLIQKHGFQYVLPGKFMSDPIEGRFGWYRQVNGGNFFMSSKQVLQAEKKIRRLSLLQQQALLSASELPDQISTPINDQGNTSIDVSWLTNFLLEVNMDDLSDADANVTYFVSGYIGRSVSRRRGCSACKQLLVQSCDAPQIQDCIPKEHTKLFEMANRGGLSVPSEVCFTVTALAVQCYTVVEAEKSMKTRLFKTSNQRSTFVHAVLKVAEQSRLFNSIAAVKCSLGHNNFRLIVETAFNCFAKNELKRFNDRKSDPPAKMSRTVRKLTGKSKN